MPPHRRTESLYRIKWFWQCGELLSLRGRSPWQSPGTHYEFVHCSRRLPRPCGLAMTWKLLAGSSGLDGAAVQAGWRGRCRPPYREEMKKSPEPSWLQGRIVDPRYHPACPFGGATSGSDKPYPGNGGNRVPLLKAALRLQDRLRNQTSGPAAPARTERRLSEAPEWGGFFHLRL